MPSLAAPLDSVCNRRSVGLARKSAERITVLCHYQQFWLPL
jgi:hypothetical protein